MSDNRLKVLRMLSNVSQSDWKIGKSDDFVKAVSSKIGMLPASVFDSFSIDAGGTKKISVVDFALMTYEMSDNDRNALMGLYGIDSDTIKNILSTADEIAEIIEVHSVADTTEEYASTIPSCSDKSEKTHSNDFDEI